jgi:signal transduction histidine kinase
MPFTQADQDMLATFSSQATIAIENARLYTLTDQALAAKVEELSIMQRIDRELNASLDVRRALQLTLEWAMRQSKADAGLVGMVEAESLKVMASTDCTGILEALPPSQNGSSQGSILQESPSTSAGLGELNLPVDGVALRRVLSSGHAGLTFLDDAPQEGEIRLLDQGHSQIAAPIRREDEVIGALLLESHSPEAWNQDDLDFLTRLTDHAAIAISNAQLYAEVQAANRSKSKFVSFVAHELKNPMSSIKGYTELVANGMAGPVNEMQASFLGTVRSNVERMNTIVSDLNDLTKIQVGSLRLEFRPVSIHDLAAEVARSFHRQFEEKTLHFETALPETLSEVWADRVRMVQILTNLVSNAVKYTKPGGSIRLGAEQRRLDSDLSQVDQVHIWVQDNGIGISSEDQPRIFEPYFRTEISKEAATGTGLGLNITRSLVEMQGGRMWFESELGKGTCFHFYVPAAEAVRPQA